MDEDTTADAETPDATVKGSRAVDDFVADLAGGGPKEAGRFTLDRQRAREKLGDFQLPDNALFLVQLVQALLTRRAQQIACWYDPDDLWLLADGEGWEERDFDHLYEALLAGADDRRVRARRDLAIGLQAALHAGVAWVRVISPVENGVAFLQYDGSQTDEFGIDEGATLEAGWPLAAPRLEDAVTLIHVHYRRVVDADVEDLAVEPPGVVQVRQNCAHVTVPMTINSNDVGGAELVHGMLEHEGLAGKGFRGALGFTEAPQPSATTLQILQDGVVRASHALEGAGGLLARVEAPGLQRDLSQFEVVRDARYEAVVQAVERARERLLMSLTGRLKVLPEKLPPHTPRIRAVLRQALGEGGYTIGPKGETTDPLVQRLIATPLWPQYVSETQKRPAAREATQKLRTTKGLLLDKGNLQYTQTRQQARDDLPIRVLYLPEPQEQQWLKQAVHRPVMQYKGQAIVNPEQEAVSHQRTILGLVVLGILGAFAVAVLYLFAVL